MVKYSRWLSQKSKRRPTRHRKLMGNPYLKAFFSLRRSIPEWDRFFDSSVAEMRPQHWVRLDVVGNSLQRKYAWAVPDSRAVRILKQFSPLIEIGAGKGYWAALLQQSGVDIIAFDQFGLPENAPEGFKGQQQHRKYLRFIQQYRKFWFPVMTGGPDKLFEEAAEGRNLFLCYPDDSNYLAEKCLERFSGEYVIHVGELITTGTLSGPSQAPFGRTTGYQSQLLLCEGFYCLLSAELPSFPFGRDCITVWKRRSLVMGRQLAERAAVWNSIAEEGHGDTPDDEGSDADVLIPSQQEDSESDDASDDFWTWIPPEERLPLDNAAPCLRHLLDR